MATLVATPTILAAGPGPASGVNKRYRPAPAKTFQCRGYGDCRMVFSRSEHLARHIRKHTGERPFTCHCSKQFSRLDNLRQHAQTVHADKQDQNERMMRDLTSLHASMAAANKAGQSRSKRGQAALNAAAVIAASSSVAAHQDNSMHALETVKEEDMVHTVPPIHYRPGTSTGYEGTDTLMYSDWSADGGGGGTHPHPRPANNHSFRDSSQSFRAPSTSATTSFYGKHNSQSFLPLTTNSTSFSISVSTTRDGRPGSSSSRPTTAGATTESSSSSHARTLPPLAAVVSASIPTTPSQPSSAIPPFPSSTTTQHVLPLPGTAAFARRPHTAGRPGTAPASFFVPPKLAYVGGPGLVHHPELSLPPYGRSAELAAAAAAAAAYHHSGGAATTGSGSATTYEGEPPSPTAGSYDSPFSFNAPPAVPESTPANPRKRPFSGLDLDGSPASRRELLPPGSSSGLGEYEYGSESRPQSRRLSVLELCNDTDVDGIRPFLSGSATGSGGSASRPTTSSGLCTSASALALVDRTPPTPSAATSSALLSGAQAAAVPATSSTATTPGTQTPFGGGRISPGVRREPTSSPSPAYPTTGAGGILRAISSPDAASPPSSWSPLSSRRGDPQPQHQLQQQHRQYGTQQQQHSGQQQQQQQQQQREARSPVTNAYPPVVGMKV
ncbi:hypothetical protein J3A83DRAFT_4100142 [Scleroderma citrinum]